MFPSTEMFSRKVFIGGLPLCISEMELKQIFGRYGTFIVEWSSRASELSQTQKIMRHNNAMFNTRTGYAFLIYTEEIAVYHLISQCHRVGPHYYINIAAYQNRLQKIVQVRPWRLTDTQYIPNPLSFLNSRNTVFIGAMPRTTTAKELGLALESKFGPVCYVGIDVDTQLNYPKGAARVTFITYKSFIAAIVGRFVDVPNTDGYKSVEIKPYVIKDQMCDNCFGKLCMNRPAPYFCSDIGCLQYYCEACWDHLHYNGNNRVREQHKPFMKMDNGTPLHTYRHNFSSLY